VFALATVLSYLLLGFLISYLWTRLYFAGALRAADVESLAQEIKEIRQQTDLDARAFALALRQLNPSVDVPSPNQQELNDAIEHSSPSVKAQLFYQAQTLRGENWADGRTKFKMERTIPIFLALIHSDVEAQFHRNYAQLGYALKDSRKPQWEEAEAALTRAIEIRGPWQQNGWLYYEFNRAICRIMRDDPEQSSPSAPEIRARIIEDLKAVFSDRNFRQIVDREPEIGKWMKANDVTIADLEILRA
jgi:hypothetical protein